MIKPIRTHLTLRAIVTGMLLGAVLTPCNIYSGLKIGWSFNVQLIVWVFAVSFLGIWVAWYLRESLILRSGLAFPTGRATAETLLEIFDQGREATLKLRVLLASTAFAGSLKWLDGGWLSLPRPSLGFLLPATGKLAGFGGISAKNLTFTLDPSLMLAGFGAIIGFRASASLLLGGIVAWGVLGPWGLSQGFVAPGVNDLSASWFPSMIEWLLWPGVALMVASALTKFLFHALEQHRETSVRRSIEGDYTIGSASSRTLRRSGRHPIHKKDEDPVWEW